MDWLQFLDYTTNKMSIKVNIDTKDFLEIVIPAMKEEFITFDELTAVEGIDIPALRLLDFAGFDWFYKHNGLKGLAVRIQYGSMNWRSFTIRSWTRGAGYDTEYQKKIEAYDNGSLLPEFTIQAYISNNTLLGLGMVKTKDLIKYCKEGGCKQLRKTDNEMFFAVDWDDLKRKGYDLIELDKKNTST